MKIIPIFFYHEKWAVIMRKFVYSSDGVEKMGPLRGDGNFCLPCLSKYFEGREDGSPSWGRKSLLYMLSCFYYRREDGSPSWGRKFPVATRSNISSYGREDGSPSWGRKFSHYEH